MKIRRGFQGILCLPVTPFTRDDEIDESTLRSIVDIIIGDGVDGLVATGATGEFTYLSHEERKKVQEIVLDQAKGRVPVLAGTGATSTKEAIAFTRHAKDIGCDGVMLCQPLMTGVKDVQVYNYFKMIANVDIPIIVYNTDLTQLISQDLVIKLVSEFSNIVSYKEDDFTYSRFAEIIRTCKKDITILTGNPSVLLSFLTLGAHGALCAEFQSFPHLVKGVYESYKKGDLPKALEFHEGIMEMFKIIKTNFGNASFAARYKAIFKLRGVDLELAVRDPNIPVSPEQLERAAPKFTKLGLQKVL